MGQVARRGAQIALAIAVLGCGGPAPPPPPVAAPPPVLPLPPPPSPLPPPHELSAPPLALTLIDARVAQVFHVVDELSRWYPQAHAQYAAWAAREMPLDEGERAMLAQHAKVRAKRRWGSLDKAFYVNAPLAEAARTAIEKKILPPAEAEDERALLAHFDDRLGPLLASHQEALVSFEGRVASELPRAAPLLAQLGRFCEVTGTLPVRVVLVASPAPAESEGRVTRDEIVLEISSPDEPHETGKSPAAEAALGALFHTLAHAVLLQRRSTIATAARKCDEAVDDETLEEGVAYAFAPGLLRTSEHDILRETVESDRAGSLAQPRIRAERLGLALRTELSAALEGGRETIGSFMPKVCDAWAKVARP